MDDEELEKELGRLSVDEFVDALVKAAAKEDVFTYHSSYGDSILYEYYAGYPVRSIRGRL